jgi:hypothetical protein
MISAADFYHVMTAVVPVHESVHWWRIFSPDQCTGINRFVALFAVPLLSFHFISTNNPYTMNLCFIAPDTLQKLMVLPMLTAWGHLSHRGGAASPQLDHHALLPLHAAQHARHGHPAAQGHVRRLLGKPHGADRRAPMHYLVHAHALHVRVPRRAAADCFIFHCFSNLQSYALREAIAFITESRLEGGE